MPPRRIWLFEKKEGPWESFIREFFEDTPSRLILLDDPASSREAFQKGKPDVVFLNPERISLPLAQKLKAYRTSAPESRFFSLGHGPEKSSFPFDRVFEKPASLIEFQKQIAEHLPLPETLNVLVADDEPEIGNTLRDFLEERTRPSFRMRCVADGEQALAAMTEEKPDVLILDIKMPVKDGCEVYRELKRRRWDIPVIIFFDAISGDEVSQIHRIGNPAIVDKGSRQSGMPEMLALIKKMAYFG